MAKQSLMWTCLPSGLTEDGRALRVSVLLSPRLYLEPNTDKPVLSSFPEWLDWPARIATARFDFSFLSAASALATVSARIGTHAGPARVDPSLGLPDSTVWKALFRPDLRVEGYRLNRDLLDSHVLSYSANDIGELVRNLYSQLANQPGEELPKIADLLADPDWKAITDAVREVDDWGTDRGRRLAYFSSAAGDVIERRFADFKRYLAGREGEEQGLTERLARFELYHTPPLKPSPRKDRERRDDKRITANTQEFEQPPMPQKGDLAKTIDFHRMVAAMNNYPTLLRHLGLALDFLIDRAAIPRGDGRLSVEVHLPLPTPRDPQEDVSPATHTVHNDGGFYALPNPALNGPVTRVHEGLLDLYSDPTRYTVLQTDVDGAGLKLMNFARTLGGYQSDPERTRDTVSQQEQHRGAPALRTAGLMLAQNRRAQALKERFETTKQQDQNAAPGSIHAVELWAEDLVRGYRFDVWDAKVGRWRSLCRRRARYLLSGGSLEVSPKAGEEEGTVQLAATRSPDETYNQDILYLHDALVSWTGWCLTAPLPGRSIADDSEADQDPDGKPEFSDEAELPPGIDFRSRFRVVQGSLPRLRYGRSYALRARVVDLAGNSLPPRAEDFGPENPAVSAVPFLRFEPVAAPVLALVQPAPGSTERPAEGESMHRLAIRSFNTIYNDPTPSAQRTRRYAVPPRTSVREAELHGMLDDASKVDPAWFPVLAHDKDLDAADPGAALVEEQIPMQGPLDQGPPVLTSYSVYREGQSLTYLPDPLARSVAARFYGHPTISDSEIVNIPLYPDGDWPEVQPFVIELYEDVTAKPEFDAGERVLRVPLGKGERATLRLSMQLSKRALFEVMGLWPWINTVNQALLQDAIMAGQHWMFTPWQDVELVHATQRPLIEPAMVLLPSATQPIYIGRSLGDTFAVPFFAASCSLKSTDRMDLLSEWHEPVDDPSAAAPDDRSRGDLAFAVKITDPEHYAAHMTALADHSLLAPEVIGVNVSANPTAAALWVAWHREAIARKKHEFNDTRYRRVEYWLKATTRYREYLDKTQLTKNNVPTDEHTVVTGPRAVTWIPSSAPPPTPKILYVVPTFGWVRGTDGEGNRHSMRRGGGLRVYLDRLWNTSGYGEMLGVVLPPAGFSDDPNNTPSAFPYKKFVTQWGNDPIWASPFVAGMAPTRSNFPLARWMADPVGGWLPPGAPKSEADQPPGAFRIASLTPPGVADAPIEVAPHDVFFDSVQRVWYCDIEIESGRSYWPFVRLALARYQPVSVDGAHLSEVVLADFMPLTTDRWLTVRADDASRSRRVSVYGAAIYTDSRGAQDAWSPRSFRSLDPDTGAVRWYSTATVAVNSVVEVWLERLDPALGSDFGWQRVALGEPRMPHGDFFAGSGPSAPAISALNTVEKLRAQELHRAGRFDRLIAEGLADRLYLPNLLWDGQITIPESSDQSERLRIVIAEYEEYPTDDVAPYEPIPTAVGRRLVFVEHVEISP
jgi:hypothetical protein